MSARDRPSATVLCPTTVDAEPVAPPRAGPARNLTPPIAADAQRSPKWIAVGADRAHLCTFFGRPSSATVGCPDESAPILWEVGVWDGCLTDCLMRRFSEMKHQRIVALGRHERGPRTRSSSSATMFGGAPAERRAEGLRIREKHGLLEDTPLHDVTRRGSPLS
jgi:hypothetical protein